MAGTCPLSVACVIGFSPFRATPLGFRRSTAAASTTSPYKDILHPSAPLVKTLAVVFRKSLMLATASSSQQQPEAGRGNGSARRYGCQLRRQRRRAPVALALTEDDRRADGVAPPPVWAAITEWLRARSRQNAPCPRPKSPLVRQTPRGGRGPLVCCIRAERGGREGERARRESEGERGASRSVTRCYGEIRSESPLPRLHSRQAVVRLSSASVPPLARGLMWSIWRTAPSSAERPQ